MAIICCCIPIRDHEDEIPTSHIRSSLKRIIRTLVRKHTELFGNGQSDAPVSTAQVASPLSFDVASDDIQLDTATTPPRPLHFAADATRPSQQQDGQVREHKNNQVIDLEHASKGNESAELKCEGISTACCSEPQLKFSSEKSEAEVARACEESEDDVCPTCLEEYIPDNPRIVLRCSHSYHLGCIYEWMERSENCPICGMVMEFHEAA
ncbi:hypothetical protein POUND7_014842 [Theobroma cacao]